VKPDLNFYVKDKRLPVAESSLKKEGLN